MSGSHTEMLVIDWRGGDLDARDRLIVRLLPELKQIAAAKLRREAGSSLSAHDLINTAVERIMKVEGTKVFGRAHFVALASRLMRNILVEHARAKATDKRAHHKVELHTQVQGGQSFDLLELNSALIRLEAIDPSLMEIIEMRYIGGMSVPEVAEVTGWSESSVKRRWKVARAWLSDALSRPLADV